MNNEKTYILENYKKSLLKVSKHILKSTHRNLIDYYNDNITLGMDLVSLQTAIEHITKVIEINKILENRGDL